MAKIVIDVPLDPAATQQVAIELGNLLMRKHTFNIDWKNVENSGETEIIVSELGLGKRAEVKVQRRESNFFVMVLDTPYEYLDNQDEIPREITKKWSGFSYKRKTIWGYYSDYATAERCIMENWTDIYEQGYYNLACILEIPEGMCAHAEETWFKVEPIINEAAVRKQEAREKAWDEADFYGKRLGKAMYEHLKKIGYEMGSAEEEMKSLFGSSKYYSEKLGLEWIDLSQIQGGKKAPSFTEEQLSTLQELLDLPEGDWSALEASRAEALADTDYHGRPESIREEVFAFGSGPSDGPMEQSDGWMVSGYNITKIDKPVRFKNSAFCLD